MNQKVLFLHFRRLQDQDCAFFCTASWCHYLVFFIYTNSVQDGASEKKMIFTLTKRKNTMWYIKIYFYYSTRTIIYIEITKC